jgi:hypothetical protein
MHMIAIGWLWVVFMIAITEKNIVSGIMTFLFYGLAPSGLLFYWIIMQARKQRDHAAWLREREEAPQQPAAPAASADEERSAGD